MVRGSDGINDSIILNNHEYKPLYIYMSQLSHITSPLTREGFDDVTRA